MKYALINNNCTAAKLRAHLTNQTMFMAEHESPFVASLFTNDNEFFKFCSQYDYYISQLPTFGPVTGESWTSCRPTAIHGVFLFGLQVPYPVMHLDDVEIHWPHETVTELLLKKYYGRLSMGGFPLPKGAPEVFEYSNPIKTEPLFLFSFSHMYCLHTEEELDKIVYDFMRTKYNSIMLSSRKKDEFDDGKHICQFIPEWEDRDLGLDDRHKVDCGPNNTVGELKWASLVDPFPIFVKILNERFL